MSPDPESKRTGRQGGLNGWARTDARGERYQRMSKVRVHSPASDEHWSLNLFGTTVDQLTDSQRKEAATAKKAYFAKLGSASAKAIKRNKAERLRALAEKLDAEAGE
jgi:hypothetical protein